MVYRSDITLVPQRSTPWWKRLFIAGLLLVVISGISSCSDLLYGGFMLEELPQAQHFDPWVDTLVVLPFINGQSIPLTPTDLNQLTSDLYAALQEERGYQVLNEAANHEPSTEFIQPEVAEITIIEKEAEGFYYRSIRLTLRLTTWSAAELAPSEPAPEGAEATELEMEPMTLQAPRRVVVRQLDFQKVYPASARVPALPLDMSYAMKEAVLGAADAIAPKTGTDLWLSNATDPHTNEIVAITEILRGNRFAEQAQYHRAVELWSLAIMNPGPPVASVEDSLYRISQRTIDVLESREVPQETIARLRQHVGMLPLTLSEFQAFLGGVIDTDSTSWGVVIDLANYTREMLFLNLAAAHLNLYTIFKLEGRRDLAIWHLAQGWGYYPRNDLLEEWGQMQVMRNAFPPGLSNEEAIVAFLRMPPPATSRILPGVFAHTYLPTPVFPPNWEEMDRAAEEEDLLGGDIEPTELPLPTPADNPLEIQPIN